MADTLDDKAIVEIVLPFAIKWRRRVSRDDATQTVWVALLLAKTFGGDVVEATKQFAKKLLQRESDRLTEILKRVEFDEEALAHPRYNDDGVDISAVVLSTLRKLDQRDSFIFRRRFLRGEKQKTIATDLGLSAASISRRCQHAAAVFIREFNRANQ
jgi:FixJ family two-component response regulator